MDGRIFDGDGCISITTQNNKPYIIVNITGIESMLKDIGSFLLDNNIVTSISKLHHSPTSHVCEIFFYGNNTKRFLDYIYQDTEIYLDRKYNKYKEYYKDYVLENMRGIYWSKRNKAYIVSIYMNGKRIRVGQSKDLNEAVQMRTNAEIEKRNSPLV